MTRIRLICMSFGLLALSSSMGIAGTPKTTKEKPPCPAGAKRQSNGKCRCPAGSMLKAGSCVSKVPGPPPNQGCAAGQQFDPHTGHCVAIVRNPPQ